MFTNNACRRLQTCFSCWAGCVTSPACALPVRAPAFCGGFAPSFAAAAREGEARMQGREVGEVGIIAEVADKTEANR